MGRLITFITLVVLQNLLLANAEKYIMMVPPRQIRRSPSIPIRVPSNLHTTSYLKSSPYSSYGAIRPGMSLPHNNQLPLNANSYGPSQDGFSHNYTPYGKGSIYSNYGRGYIAYDKYKGGYVPSADQNRYSLEATKQRLQSGPLYGSTTTGTIYHRSADGKFYVTDKNGPIRIHQPLDRPRPTFTGLPIGKQESIPISQNTAQSTGHYAANHPNGTPRPIGDAITVTQSPDLLKESSSVIGKVPSSSNVGINSHPIVVRDSILLSDYEKRFAEFTKSWPQLSSFPGAFGSASSYLPTSQFSQTFATSANVARISDGLDQFNSIGRKGYAVKEEIDEPPIDFRTMPIITSPLHYYPTPKTPSAFSNILG